jgi:hypothetical protein
MKCTGCGCTDEKPCEGGCSWVSTDPPVCSSCAGKQLPLFVETIGGSLIDSARISVMAAMAMIPEHRIVLPGGGEDPDAPNLHNCLEEAMEWLNAARVQSIERSRTPPTSLHVVSR